MPLVQGEDIKVTVVPVIAPGIEQLDTEDVEDVLRFDHLLIVTYK